MEESDEVPPEPQTDGGLQPRIISPPGGISSRRASHCPSGRCEDWRNRAAFWILGLCNNFGYVVMLSSAHDVLRQQNTTISRSVDVRPSNTSSYDCNPVSTAAVLLADILPTLLIKLLVPFLLHTVPYGFRVLLCGVLACLSFLLLSLSPAVWVSLLGVVFASASAGLGELSFLSLTVFFRRDVLGAWSSGTGAAGVAGALWYSGLIQAGLSLQVTLQLMLLVPVGMLISYFFLLVPPPWFRQWRTRTEYQTVTSADLMEEEEEESPPSSLIGTRTGPLTLAEKLQTITGLLRFLVPLGLVYFAEYFINQGLMELLFFPHFFLSHAEQYRWYQTLYQVGVLLSRSSLCCVKIRRVWFLAVLQVLNAVFLFMAVLYRFLPSAWFMFAAVLVEGLLGGAAYVNTFYFISKEAEDRYREFSMAAASVGDSVGIALAGLAAFPVHRYFCSL